MNRETLRQIPIGTELAIVEGRNYQRTYKRVLIDYEPVKKDRWSGRISPTKSGQGVFVAYESTHVHYPKDEKGKYLTDEKGRPITERVRVWVPEVSYLRQITGTYADYERTQAVQKARTEAYQAEKQAKNLRDKARWVAARAALQSLGVDLPDHLYRNYNGPNVTLDLDHLEAIVTAATKEKVSA